MATTPKTVRVTAKVDVPLTYEEAVTYCGRFLPIATDGTSKEAFVYGVTNGEDGTIWLHIEFDLPVSFY